MKKLLITTAIDYTNDVAHLGHSYQKIVADCLARYYKIKLGEKNVFFVTGTDEHGGNIEASAKLKKQSVKSFVDAIAEEDKKQWKALNIKYDRFIRTTDEDHEKVVADFWQKCLKAGDIYKGKFSGLYCFGCESYKTDDEIIKGKCEFHPTKELQKIEEENYFFKWSKYQKFLEDFFKKNPDFVHPPSRLHEMASFLKRGLEDIPVSRSKDKVNWGIPVPGDPTQTIYVWFDGLISYFSAGSKAGFWPMTALARPSQSGNTKIIHILGKDNTRWHAVLWPAMLKSAKYKLPDLIYSHGFINLDGQKISKSLGNVIRPTELVEKYGADAVRYYLLKYGPAVDDVDLSLEKLKQVYNSELANDWGNLVQRVATLCSKLPTPGVEEPRNTVRDKLRGKTPGVYSDKVANLLENLQIPQALENISARVTEVNQFINEKEPWNKSGEELEEILNHAVSQIRQIAFDLQPFMPESSEKILKQFSGEKFIPGEIYFKRI